MEPEKSEISENKVEENPVGNSDANSEVINAIADQKFKR